MNFKNNNLFIDSGAIIGISVGHSAQGYLHNKLLINFNGNVQEIHLAFHNDFVFSDIVDEKSYIWDSPKIYISRLKSLAARCLKIIKTQKENTNLLPYAIGYKNIRTFDKEGVYSDYSGNAEFGMTCATFVLTVFNSVGINLLDWINWVDREEDKVWVEQLERILKIQVRLGKVSEEHFKNVISEKNCAKIRPEEVYSSVFCKKQPMKFACSSGFGGVVREYCLELPSAK